MWNYFKFKPVVQEEMSFKKQFTDDGRQMKTHQNSSPRGGGGGGGGGGLKSNTIISLPFAQNYYGLDNDQGFDAIVCLRLS